MAEQVISCLSRCDTRGGATLGERKTLLSGELARPLVNSLVRFIFSKKQLAACSSDARLFISSFCCLSWWNVYLYILRCAVRVGKFTGLRHAQLACGILIKALIQQPARGEVTGAFN